MERTVLIPTRVFSKNLIRNLTFGKRNKNISSIFVQTNNTYINTSYKTRQIERIMRCMKLDRAHYHIFGDKLNRSKMIMGKYEKYNIYNPKSFL